MSLVYPKSARLLSRRDFTFRRFETRDLGLFKILVSFAGKGRLGISVPKRIVKLAAGRNRVKRLFREAFRMRRGSLAGVDLHVIGRNQLGTQWKNLKLLDIQKTLDELNIVPSRAL
ncbi:MAG: ribonuclease P protein component [Deltaproteobacteria bacterium]|nr:ribonuclease P protein component [Deltaproteobacteria bacterium]MBI3293739.1 ribonuclease P protein component [Deltaproteobacteria bacterium]